MYIPIVVLLFILQACYVSSESVEDPKYFWAPLLYGRIPHNAYKIGTSRGRSVYVGGVNSDDECLGKILKGSLDVQCSNGVTVSSSSGLTWILVHYNLGDYQWIPAGVHLPIVFPGRSKPVPVGDFSPQNRFIVRAGSYDRYTIGELYCDTLPFCGPVNAVNAEGEQQTF